MQAEARKPLKQPEWKPGAIRSPTDFTRLPDGARVENLSFAAEDGPVSQGTLYSLGGERTVVCITHPRGDLSRHYMIPYLLDAGYAVCGFTHRALITDFALMHEVMVLDIAGCLRMLKAERGFETVVLLANSGGGGIFGLYQWQAETAPPARLSETPSGDPPDLNKFDLPAADGLILLATPFGESTVTTRGLDPSVIDEADPLSCDPALDMYDERNGFREPPETSRYSDEFKARYQEAQLQRVSRIDAKARALVAEQRRYQAQMREPGFANLPVNERSYIKRRAADTPPMLVYRTDASLAFCDLSLFPSKRSVGTFFMADTQFLNYCRQTIAQYKSPRAWLSASSGLSSNSTLRKALPNISVPTVVINYSADRGVYPQDARELLALSASADKQLHEVDGDHFGLPVDGLDDPAPRDTVARILSPWLRERFRSR
jgi:pimeloyl-ACP methyl ester carboxylesterase